MEHGTEPVQKRDPGDYDALLERAPELEAWHGIVLDHLTAQYDRSDRQLNVFCEIRPAEGPKLKHGIELLAVLYDHNGRIIERDRSLLGKDKFFGFEIVQLTFCNLTPKKMMTLQKIKVFPAKW